jgi:hypothetical protein
MTQRDGAATKPFDDCYWVVPDKLLAGEYPGAPFPWQSRIKLLRLLDAGITHFLDLTSKQDPLKPYLKQLRELATARGMTVTYSRKSIPDRGCPSKDLMREILDEIEGAISEGHRVYVHCWGGVGRTGMVIGCHLVRSGSTGEVALARLAELFGGMSRLKRAMNPRSPETDAQRSFVVEWVETSDNATVRTRRNAKD